MKMTYIITTLGCRVNQSESESIARQLQREGWRPAALDSGSAHLHIINTCTVTGKAAMQARGAIRSAIRSTPDALILVTGCFAQTETEAAAAIHGVHYVVGQSWKHRIPEIIGQNSRPPSKPVIRCPSMKKEREFSLFPLEDLPDSGDPARSEPGRSRPTLKIQDGCDAFCTYCIVPYARGRSRSMPMAEVMNGLRGLKAAGYHEGVLSGIHLGCYGRDLDPARSLFSLLCRIRERPPIDRIRLSSIEPHELTHEIIETVAASPLFCRHFHIPLQSGNDEILRRMGRPYTRKYFNDLVISVRERIEDAAIGTDVLVGFPGESDAAFDHTLQLLKSLPITYLHVFPFSPRKGTPASRFSDQIPPGTIKKRCKELRELGRRKKLEFWREQQGRIAEVIIEERKDFASHPLKGISSNYIPVLIDGKNYFKNFLAKVRLDEVKENDFMTGIILE